jgi:hypothetical protein
MLLDFWVQSARAGGFQLAKVPSSSAPISGEYPATSAIRKGGHPKLDSVLVQGALLSDGLGADSAVSVDGREWPESVGYQTNILAGSG